MFRNDLDSLLLLNFKMSFMVSKVKQSLGKFHLNWIQKQTNSQSADQTNITKTVLIRQARKWCASPTSDESCQEKKIPFIFQDGRFNPGNGSERSLYALVANLVGENFKKKARTIKLDQSLHFCNQHWTTFASMKPLNLLFRCALLQNILTKAKTGPKIWNSDKDQTYLWRPNDNATSDFTNNIS